MWWLQSFNTWIVPATATTLKPINPSAFRITSGEASEKWKVLGRCQNQTSYLKPAHQSSFLKIRLRSCQYVKILMSLWLREYWSLWISKILLFTLPVSHFHRIKCNTNTMHLCLPIVYPCTCCGLFSPFLRTCWNFSWKSGKRNVKRNDTLLAFTLRYLSSCGVSPNTAAKFASGLPVTATYEDMSTLARAELTYG